MAFSILSGIGGRGRGFRRLRRRLRAGCGVSGSGEPEVWGFLVFVAEALWRKRLGWRTQAWREGFGI